MSEEDFNNFLTELKRVYYKTHKKYKAKVRDMSIEELSADIEEEEEY